MTLTAAITVNVEASTVLTRLPEAESPLSDTDDVTISTGPAPGGRGTELRVAWDAHSPSGIGRAVATLTGGDPQRRLDDAMRRFKQLVETGEVLRSDGSPQGTDAHDQRHQRPARPTDSSADPDHEL